MRQNKDKILKELRNSEAIDYYISSMEDLEGIKRIVKEEKDKESFEWINEEFWEEKRGC